MMQEEIQNWIYELKEVDALSAKALLRVYEQLGLSAAADRLGAISSRADKCRICQCLAVGCRAKSRKTRIIK